MNKAIFIISFASLLMSPVYSQIGLRGDINDNGILDVGDMVLLRDAILSDADLGEAIPSYYNQEVSTVVELLNTQGSHNDNFVFVTDEHFTKTQRYINSNHTLPLLRNILGKTFPQTIINCGDMLMSNDTKEDALNYLRQYFFTTEHYFGKDYRYVFGNHDNNPQPDGNPNDTISAFENYMLTIKSLENDVIGDLHNFYYYWDNSQSKIRYFVLNSGTNNVITNQQISWFADKLSNLENGWNVAVFVHAALVRNGAVYNETESAAKILDIMDAANCKRSISFDVKNYIFSNKDIRCLFLMCGHNHVDKNMVHGTSKIPVISCATTGLPISNTGTYKETTMSFVDIDLSCNELHLIRFGVQSSVFGRETTISLPSRK